MDEVSYFDMLGKLLFSPFEKEVDGVLSLPIDDDLSWNVVQMLKTMETDEEKEEDCYQYISLMALNYMLNLYDQEKASLAPLILQYPPSQFVLLALDDETILETLVQNEIECYSTDEPFPYELLSSFLKQPLESELYPTGKDLYQAYHPFYEKENLMYQHWMKKEHIRDQLIAYSLNHFLEFYLFGKTFQEQGGSLTEATQILADKLEDLGKENPVLFRACAKEFLTLYYTINKQKVLQSLPLDEEAKRWVDDLEVMTEMDMYSYLANDDTMRKTMIAQVLTDYDLMTYPQVEKQVSSYQKKFLQKFN